MQVLVAPSRDEIDAAHCRSTWLDIGVSSLHNVWNLSILKKLCWYCLSVTSFPIHLLSNSILFSTECWGHIYPLTDCTSSTSVLSNNITSIAEEDRKWSNLSFHECQAEYGLYGKSCHGLEAYRDMILVMAKPEGWTRDTDLWDQTVPCDKPNHLFYHTNCQMAPSFKPNLGSCYDICSSALDGTLSDDETSLTPASKWPSPYPFFSNQEVYHANITTGCFITNLTSGAPPGTFNLDVRYCLAKPATSDCHIALSPKFLLVVVFVSLARQLQPLVTIGDFLASLIATPNPHTCGFSTLALACNGGKNIILGGPRPWPLSAGRRAAVIPCRIWMLAYITFIAAAGTSIALLALSKSNSGGVFQGQFLAGTGNPLIDLRYYHFQTINLSFNNIFTHLQIPNEWSTFAQGYHPLRVTYPKGKQQSTLPPMSLSAVLHWLLSNTIYVTVSQGGMNNTARVNFDIINYYGYNDPGLRSNTHVLLGYSPVSLLVLTILSSVLATIPIIFSLKRLPSNVVAVGTNSLAIATASRATIRNTAEQQRTQLYEDTTYPNNGLHHGLSPDLKQVRSGSSEDGGEVQNEAPTNNRIRYHGQNKIRWGVLYMPPEWYEENDFELLGFAAEGYIVGTPVPGR
ncbi:hypothetical protein GGR57DRAFT_492132 [Xylariaceae sp. FL1272]|nr:hypothetical protein GGR57DRAFT_492132 [Xylariaceae sp. FL1272]